jgi:hypothetical protein
LACKSFRDLHKLVREKIGPIPDIGELTVYDTALRLSAFLRCRPREVYLHAGAREGFIALNGRPAPPTASRNAFPSPVGGLKGYEIEDFLCIFKAELADPQAGARKRSCCLRIAQRRS